MSRTQRYFVKAEELIKPFKLNYNRAISEYEALGPVVQTDSMVRRELFRHDLEAAQALGFHYSLVPTNRMPPILKEFERQIKTLKKFV